MERDANKIVYSMKVMTQLVKLGYLPIYEIPNPTNSKLTAWVFEWTDSFDAAFDAVQRKNEGDLNGRK